MSPEEQQFFTAFEKHSNSTLLEVEEEEGGGDGEALCTPGFTTVAPLSAASSSAAGSMRTPLGASRDEEEEVEDYGVNIDEEDECDSDADVEDVDEESNGRRENPRVQQLVETTSNGDYSSCSSGVADPNNLSLICNADEEDEEDDGDEEPVDDENDRLKVNAFTYNFVMSSFDECLTVVGH